MDRLWKQDPSVLGLVCQQIQIASSEETEESRPQCGACKIFSLLVKVGLLIRCGVGLCWCCYVERDDHTTMLAPGEGDNPAHVQTFALVMPSLLNHPVHLPTVQWSHVQHHVLPSERNPEPIDLRA